MTYWILGNLEVLAAAGVRSAEADKPELSLETVRNCQRAWIVLKNSQIEGDPRGKGHEMATAAGQEPPGMELKMPQSPESGGPVGVVLVCTY